MKQLEGVTKENSALSNSKAEYLTPSVLGLALGARAKLYQESISIPFIPKGLFWIYFFVGPFVILLMLIQDGSECVLFLHVIHLLIHLYTFPVCCFNTICVTVGFFKNRSEKLPVCSSAMPFTSVVDV